MGEPRFENGERVPQDLDGGAINHEGIATFVKCVFLSNSAEVTIIKKCATSLLFFFVLCGAKAIFDGLWVCCYCYTAFLHIKLGRGKEWTYRF